MKIKYSKKKAQIIVDCLKELSTISAACDAANIDRMTYYAWLRDIPEFKEFMEKSKGEIEESCRMKAIKAINDNFSKNWTSAAWWLERTYPDEFGRKEKIEQNMTVSQVRIVYKVPEGEDIKPLEEGEIIKILPPIENNNE
jgi:hypothetical protein